MVPTGGYLSPTSPLSLGSSLQAQIEGLVDVPAFPFDRRMSVDRGFNSDPPAVAPHSPPPHSSAPSNDESSQYSPSPSPGPEQQHHDASRPRRSLPRRRSRLNRKPIVDDDSDSDDVASTLTRKRTSRGGTSKRRRASKKTPAKVSRPSTAAAAAAPKDSLEAMRLEKNRQSARECRLRKKKYIQGLEEQVQYFEETEAERVAELRQVKEQLAALEHKYSQLLQQLPVPLHV